MQKLITRSVTHYNHLFVKTEKIGNGIAVVDQKEVTFAEKLGTKKAAAYAKEQGWTGYILAAVDETPVKYAMPLETFLQHATLVAESSANEQ